jgi:two-component system nitrogen regulation response regulator GlnG
MAPEILGKAAAMQDVFRAIGRLSQSHATVLINGESGTGKELVARALHRHSPRKRCALHRDQHGRHPARPARIRTVRPRERAPSPAPPRCVAAASNRPTAARCSSTKSATCRRTADPPAARAVRWPLLPGRRTFADQGECAGHRRHPPESRGPGQAGPVPRRPVPPAQRDPAAHSAAARAARGHSAAGAALPDRKARRNWASMPSACPSRRPRYLQGLEFPGNVRQLENLCHWLTVMAPGQVVDVKDLPAELRSQPVREADGDWGAALAIRSRSADCAQAAGAVRPPHPQEFERTLIRRALPAPAAAASNRLICSASAATPSRARSRNSGWTTRILLCPGPLTRLRPRLHGAG